jgi:hypothetical protein
VERLVITKASLGRVPAGEPNGGESGPVPLANTWRSSCRYCSKLEGISFPEQTEKLTPPGKSVALKETLGRGLITDQHVWISPNNGFTSGSLFVSTLATWVGRDSL